MARKIRKRPNMNHLNEQTRNTVGDIRLSVSDMDSSGSIQNQRFMIEEWVFGHQTPIMHYYIDNGFSGTVLTVWHFSRWFKMPLPMKSNVSSTKTFLGWGASLSQSAITWGCYFPNSISVLSLLAISLIPLTV